RGQRRGRRPVAGARGGVGTRGRTPRAGLDREGGFPARHLRPGQGRRRRDAARPPGALLRRPEDPRRAPAATLAAAAGGPLVLDGLAGTLAVVDEQIVEPGSVEQARLRGWIARRFGPALARLGWMPAPDEDDATRLRRAALLRLVGGIAETPAVLAEARTRLDAYLRHRAALDPNLADPVVGL